MLGHLVYLKNASYERLAQFNTSEKISTVVGRQICIDLLSFTKEDLILGISISENYANLSSKYLLGLLERIQVVLQKKM